MYFFLWEKLIFLLKISSDLFGLVYAKNIAFLWKLCQAVFLKFLWL